MYRRAHPFALSLQKIVDNKSNLLVAISIAVIAVLCIPVILPHISHPSMIYHILLHVTSLIVAVFLTIIAALAYKRSGSTRVLFMFLGFLLLTIVELIYLFNSTGDLRIMAIPLVQIELSHIILLVMLTLFGIGVIKVDR